MKAEILEQLSDADDLVALTKAVLSLCAPFGPVHSFRVVHNRGAGRVACFIELESTRLQPALARALGTGAVNGAVCFDVPVGREFGGHAPVRVPGAVTATPKPVPQLAR
jgi:hypothetical protein